MNDWLGEGEGLAPQDPVLLTHLPVVADCFVEVPRQTVIVELGRHRHAHLASMLFIERLFQVDQTLRRLVGLSRFRDIICYLTSLHVGINLHSLHLYWLEKSWLGL